MTLTPITTLCSNIHIKQPQSNRSGATKINDMNTQQTTTSPATDLNQIPVQGTTAVAITKYVGEGIDRREYFLSVTPAGEMFWNGRSGSFDAPLTDAELEAVSELDIYFYTSDNAPIFGFDWEPAQEAQILTAAAESNQAFTAWGINY
jgi:GH35 family endo-1,4-beta-xylanase